jgi:hypothetical protein
MNFSNTSNDDDRPVGCIGGYQMGKESLTKYVSVPELDDLVGWATHQQSSVPVVD